MFLLKKFYFILLIQWIFILINSDCDTFVLGFETNFNQSNLFNNQNNSIHLKRTKRGVFQLSGIIKCMTGCKPLSYRRYGCFCGYMGSGQPVDNIDKCCQEHDYCYSHTTCAHLMVYLLPYQWKCTESGDAKCATLENTKTAADKCSYQLCECDRILGECLSKHECPTNRPACVKQTDQI